MATIKKMTWEELTEVLTANHERRGVVVFKQIPAWDKEYSELSRSYEVHGNDNHFHTGKISDAVYGTCLDGSEDGVRLDWYMKDPDPKYRWQVDYCYLLP